jgi:hypothetical protein
MARSLLRSVEVLRGEPTCPSSEGVGLDDCSQLGAGKARRGRNWVHWGHLVFGGLVGFACGTDKALGGVEVFFKLWKVHAGTA